MAKLFANSGDPDQMPHSAASDLGLHCLPITLLWVSRLQWVKLCSVSRHMFLLMTFTNLLYILRQTGLNILRVGIRLIVFLFLDENIKCCWYSLEAPHRGISNEYPQHMFLLRIKKIIDTFWLKKKLLIKSYRCRLCTPEHHIWSGFSSSNIADISTGITDLFTHA